ncbi:hypothetical protein ABZ027_01415 [Streptomyces sp. NPDC006332]|uniref:hypothetical protein n=1 Tax=Streptomyces sp. NPDC006332 TaxID=3155456 RepID=UPI0033B59E2E
MSVPRAGVDTAWLPARLPRGYRAVWAVAVRGGRRVRRCLWPTADGARNRVFLRDRLVTLPLLAVVGFGAFGWAHTQVRDDSAFVRDRAAPALVGLADARTSLFIAQGAAEENIGGGRAAGIGGLGERYRTRVTRATQSLNQVISSGALTVAEEQELRVVSALLVGYTGYIGQAQEHAEDPVLRETTLAYARSMLCSSRLVTAAGDRYPSCAPTTGSTATSIVDRVSGLERALRDRLTGRALWGGRVLAAAVVGVLALALFAVGIWRTLDFLRHRFRIRLSVPLAIAALPLLALPLLAADALLAQRAQHDVLPVAGTLAERTSPDTEAVAEERPFASPDPRAVEVLADRMDDSLADGRFAFLDGVGPFVFPAGLAVAALVGGTLHTYRREYLVVARPGAAV